MFDHNNTVKLELSQGYYALVDADCPEWIKKQKWSLTKVGSSKKLYGVCAVKKQSKRTTLLLHRAILDAKDGQFVDHINGNSLDNRKSNLRFCSPSQNVANSGPKFGRKFKGVYYRKDRNKWVARLGLNYKKVYLGDFDTEIDAANAYNKAAKKYFQEFCKPNEFNA